MKTRQKALLDPFASSFMTLYKLLELCESQFSHMENWTVFCRTCLAGMLVGKETVTLALTVIIAQHLLFLAMLLSSPFHRQGEGRKS